MEYYNKIQEVAFIIPIHPPSYHYIYRLLPKIKNKIDLFLVFSTESDYELFEYKEMINHIILPIDYYDISIVAYKKLYALQELQHSNYKYFIVCDSEIDIVCENFTRQNILQKIDNIFKNKIIYAGKTDITKEAVSKNASYFLDETGEIYNKIRNFTDEFQLFYWWSDLPVFKREHLSDFFSKIKPNFSDYVISDILLYTNYLIFFHDFKMLDITNMLNHKWSLEIYYTDDINKIQILKDNHYGFSWIYHIFWYNKKDILMKEGTFLLYHLDREIILRY